MIKKLLFLVLLLCPVFVLAAGTVDINIASLSQLDELTGIGPKYAQAIIDARPFSSVDDLDRVKGIGPKTLQKIKEQGLAYVSGIPQSQPVIQPAAPSNDRANPTPSIVYPSGVFINEILANPAGADETNEWIELYNSNNYSVDLSDWQLQDTVGTITTFKIPQNIPLGAQAKILANGFLVFKRPDTKIMLNNDQDGVNLLTPDKKIVDSVTFTKAPLGQSYNRTSNNWVWSLTLTPGAKNTITGVGAKAPSTSSGPDGLLNAKNSVTNDGVAYGLADISQTTNPWFLFFAVLAITIILAIIVLFIKLKFLNHVRT